MRKDLWKAYYRGYRMAKRHERYSYTLNPYDYMCPEWYAFNAGWNKSKASI